MQEKIIIRIYVVNVQRCCALGLITIEWMRLIFLASYKIRYDTIEEFKVVDSKAEYTA